MDSRAWNRTIFCMEYIFWKDEIGIIFASIEDDVVTIFLGFFEKFRSCDSLNEIAQTFYAIHSLIRNNNYTFWHI